MLDLLVEIMLGAVAVASLVVVIIVAMMRSHTNTEVLGLGGGVNHQILSKGETAKSTQFGEESPGVTLDSHSESQTDSPVLSPPAVGDQSNSTDPGNVSPSFSSSLAVNMASESATSNDSEKNGSVGTATYSEEEQHDSTLQISQQNTTVTIDSGSENTSSFEAGPTFDQQETKSPDENQVVPASPTVEDPAPSSETPQFTHAESSMSLPTDNSALRNISITPIPNGTQSVSQHGASISAYCVKCRAKKQIRDPFSVTLKNGRPAIRGFCFDCGTKVFRIGSTA